MSSSGLAAPSSFSERTRRRSIAPRGWPHLALQVVLLGSFSVIYALTGLYGRNEAGHAIAHARDVLQLETVLHIDWEHGIQDWALRGPNLLLDVANYTYFNCQFSLSVAFLIWVYFRRNDRFARVRDALLAANYVSLVVMFVYPLAPPRMLGSFVDTLDANSVNLHTSFIEKMNNPYSAMPSLHASYAIVISIAGVALTRRWWTKLIWLLYPGLVSYSIVATGNHFVLDVVAGAAVLLATPVVSWASSRLARVWGDRGLAGANA